MNIPSIKFHGDSPSSSLADTCGQTDMTNLTDRSRDCGSLTNNATNIETQFNKKLTDLKFRVTSERNEPNHTFGFTD